MTEDNLTYNQQEYDRIEGLAQDAMAAVPLLDAAEAIIIVRPEEDAVRIDGRELEYFRTVNPQQVVKMVVIARRFRYLYEKLTEEAKALLSEAQTLKTQADSLSEEVLAMRDALVTAAADAGKELDYYLYQPNPEDAPETEA
jgi:hypothetical protein